MNEENVLNCFMDGFAKVAEAAGFTGDSVRGLMELSLDLAQRDAHPAEFDEGFFSVVMGG